MLKKLLMLLIPLILVLGFPFSTTNAETNNKNDKEFKTIFKAKEITDSDKLLESAAEENHVNLNLAEYSDSVLELKQYAHIEPDNKLKNTNNSELKEIKGTAQLLEIKENESSDREELYAVSFIANVEEDEDGSFQITDSNNRSKWDDSGSVKAISTSYFTVKNDSSGVHHAKLTSANGNWSVQQTGVNLSNRSVVYGTVGLSSFGNAFGQKDTIDPSGNSWTVTTPSSWVHAETGTSESSIGTIASVKLSGRTSSTLQLINQWGS